MPWMVPEANNPDDVQLGAHLVHHFVFSLQTNKNILSVVRVLGALSM